MIETILKFAIAGGAMLAFMAIFVYLVIAERDLEKKHNLRKNYRNKKK